MPIYAVKSKTGGKTRIIEATNRNVAINHVVKGEYEAELLSASDIVARMGDEGFAVEKSGVVEVEAPAPTEAKPAAKVAPKAAAKAA